MAHIRTIPESEATGDLAALYERTGNPDGTVDNVMKVHSLNPDSLRSHFEMYTACMHKPSALSRAEREMVAVTVSRLNGCGYCLAHHRAGLERLVDPERVEVAAALASGEPALLSERERAMVAFAEKLTRQPAAMTADDTDALRQAGLDDRAILDLAQCTGYFNYVNRIVTGLGVELGAGEGSAGQWPATPRRS
jgi:uncharacterized peroxidase-related enzyme